MNATLKLTLCKSLLPEWCVRGLRGIFSFETCPETYYICVVGPGEEGRSSLLAIVMSWHWQLLAGAYRRFAMRLDSSFFRAGRVLAAHILLDLGKWC